jgi:hypothetical protein
MSQPMLPPLIANSTARCGAFFFILGGTATAEPIDFNRDVRPVLADKCFACHGGDAKSLKGELRLDLRDKATAPAKSGKTAIVPGNAKQSELAQRIGSSDPDDLMPPPDSHKSLTAEEKTLLTRWIAEGAEYKDHWSFIRPGKESPPAASDATWNEHAIDRFVYAALERRGMKPAGEADRLTLIRRVSLDVRGVPPSLAEIDSFTSGGYPKNHVAAIAADGSKKVVWENISREKSFELLATNQLGNDVMATPTICDGQIFARVAAAPRAGTSAGSFFTALGLSNWGA